MASQPTPEQIKELLDKWSKPERSAYGGAHTANGEYLDMEEFVRDVWRTALEENGLGVNSEDPFGY